MMFAHCAVRPVLGSGRCIYDKLKINNENNSSDIIISVTEAAALAAFNTSRWLHISAVVLFIGVYASLCMIKYF